MSPFGLAISGVLFIAGHFVTDGILEYRRGQDLMMIFKNELDTLHQKATDIDQFFSNTNEITSKLPQDFQELNEALQLNNLLIVNGRLLIQMISLMS